MSDDLRNAIASTLEYLWDEADEMGLIDADVFRFMAERLPVQVRPGVRIMAVTEYFRAYRIPLDPDNLILDPYYTAPLYREATDD